MKNENNNQDKIHIGDVSLYAHWKDTEYCQSLCIGKVEVARYFYDGLRPASDVKRYKVQSRLPSIKTDLGNYETISECKEICVKVAKTLFNQLINHQHNEK